MTTVAMLGWSKKLQKFCVCGRNTLQTLSVTRLRSVLLLGEYMEKMWSLQDKSDIKGTSTWLVKGWVYYYYLK